MPGFEAADPSKERPNGRTIFAVSADGKRAVTQHADNAYLVFEVATGNPVRIVKTPGSVAVGVTREVYPVSLSADGKTLAFDAPGKGPTRDAIVWDVEKDVQLARVTALQNKGVVPLLAPDGKTLATYGRHEGDGPDGAPRSRRPGVGRRDRQVDRHPPGSVPELRRARFLPGWTDARHGRAIGGLGPALGCDHRQARAPAPRPGRVGGGPGVLSRRQDAGRTGAERDDRPVGAARRQAAEADLVPAAARPADAGNNPWAHGVGFADNERVVAWGWVWGVALVWEAPSGKLLTPIAGHVGAINAVRFTADGKEVVTAGADLRVLRWNPATGRQTVVGRGSPARPVPVHTTWPRAAPGGCGGRERFSTWRAEKSCSACPRTAPARPTTSAAPPGSARRLQPTPAPLRCDATCGIWRPADDWARVELPATADLFLAPGTTVFSPDDSRLITAVASESPGPSDGCCYS